MKLYWDLDNHVLVAGLSSTQQVNTLTLTLRDLVPITLYTVRPTTSLANAYYAAEDVPAGQSIVFAAKAAAALSGNPPVDQLIWTKTGTGIYEANLWLGQDLMVSTIASAATVELVAEFALRDADEVDHDSTQFTLTIQADVNRLTDSPGAGSSYTGGLVTQELINGLKVIIIRNSDGVEYARYNPPGA
jgi:hypothetical protein